MLTPLQPRSSSDKVSSGSTPLQPRSGNETTPTAESVAALRQRCDEFRKAAAALQLENATLREKARRHDELEDLVAALRLDNQALRTECSRLRASAPALAGERALAPLASDSKPLMTLSSLDNFPLRVAQVPPAVAAAAPEEEEEEEEDFGSEDKENGSPDGARRAAVAAGAPPVRLTEESALRVFAVLEERDVSPCGSEYEEESDEEHEAQDGAVPRGSEATRAVRRGASSALDPLSWRSSRRWRRRVPARRRGAMPEERSYQHVARRCATRAAAPAGARPAPPWAAPPTWLRLQISARHAL
jgi:hypothetical protein